MARVLLLCAPINTGKSTALACIAAKLHHRVYGVVAHGCWSPEGVKGYEIEFLPSGERKRLEANESTKNVVSTLKFKFDGDVLKKETEHIFNSMFPCTSSECEDKRIEEEEWVFVDEIGPIELRQKKGLWTVLESVPKSKRNVLIVVRSDLEEDVKELLLGYNPSLNIETFHLSGVKNSEDLLKTLVRDTELENNA